MKRARFTEEQIIAKPNARWPPNFVHDQFANGRRFRNIVDDVRTVWGPFRIRRSQDGASPEN